MKAARLLVALFVVLAVTGLVIAASPRAAEHAVAGEVEGTLHFVPFDSQNLSDLYAIHSIGVSSGVLKSIGIVNLFTVQKPTAQGDVIDGHVWMVTPSGERLEGEYVGTTRPGTEPGKLVGRCEFVISGGTGRFANATGTIHAVASVTFLGFNTWTWPVTWTLEGTISY